MDFSTTNDSSRRGEVGLARTTAAPWVSKLHPLGARDLLIGVEPMHLHFVRPLRFLTRLDYFAAAPDQLESVHDQASRHQDRRRELDLSGDFQRRCGDTDNSRQRKCENARRLPEVRSNAFSETAPLFPQDRPDLVQKHGVGGDLGGMSGRMTCINAKTVEF